ncbi:mechanosensitive ion channel domain-containing protein [uncultured Draconibacterium sp.]|uniref:mechanosensitive ion channel family protein n=1 Tax=uncultured Draconibacterium sp. TaxID=1573823 RepID=UPI0029C7C114|nr:mechanosensitive ion channel domain-containing protein [uncultured Draconibacterium sp.]
MKDLNELFDSFLMFIPQVGLGLLILLVFVLISWLFKSIITKRIKPRTKNPLLAEFFGKVIAFIFSLIGFIFFLHIVGLGRIATHIVAGAGITTFIIGFAFKDIGENFLSGILMAFKSPFKIGDLIELDTTIGYVYALDLRVTSVKTLDGKDVFIPNSQIIKSPLVNYTIDGYLRYEIVVGLDYNTNFEKAIKCVEEVLLSVDEVLRGEKKPLVTIEELNVSTVNLHVFYWIDTFKSKNKGFHLVLKSKISIAIIDALNNAEIYLPADIIEIKNYNASSLSCKSRTTDDS